MLGTTHRADEIWKTGRERIEHSGVRYLELTFADIAGVIKSVSMSVDHVAEAHAGGVPYQSQQTGEHAMMLVPDLDTFTILPSGAAPPHTARVLCDIRWPSDAGGVGPRALLGRVLDEADQMGFVPQMAAEADYYVLDTDAAGQPMIDRDPSSYRVGADLANRIERARIDTLSALESMGIAVSITRHGGRAGQHEIRLGYEQLLTTADHTVTIRSIVKTLARRNSLHATFMPKPFAGQHGSGWRLRQRMLNKADGRDAWADRDHPYGLSEIGLCYLAGQMEHAAGMAAILGPSVNSYKRLAPEDDTPLSVAWGLLSKRPYARVPDAREGTPAQIALYAADSTAHPYLALAIACRCGLSGISLRSRITPPSDASPTNSTRGARSGASRSRLQPRLPLSLGQAIEALDADGFIRSSLGAPLYARYQESRLAEWAEYQAQVTDWEVQHDMGHYQRLHDPNHSTRHPHRA